jgi:hypothetical protein
MKSVSLVSGSATVTRKELAEDVTALSPLIPVKEIDYCTHISFRYKYIYNANPKCACSMIRLALLRLERSDLSARPVALDVIHSRDFCPTLRPLQIAQFGTLLARGDFFKFTFVRDPYERLLSAYLDKIVAGQPQKRKVLEQLGRGEEPLRSHVSFSDFVGVVARQSIQQMDMHWRVQYHQILYEAFRYDHIGRVETFSQDIAVVANRIHPDLLRLVPPKPINVRKATAQVEKYYPRALRDLVNRTYEIDFTTFGYEFR